MAQIQTPARHGSKWRVRERGTRRWVSFDTEREAEQFILDDRKAIKVEGRRANMRSGAGPTLAEYRERWLPARAQQVLPRTLENQQSAWSKWIEPALGGERIRRLDRETVWEWLADMEKAGASESVRHAALMQVSAILSAAVADELLGRNILHGTRHDRGKPKVTLPNTEARSATWDEVQALLKALPEHYVLLFRTMAETGLRIQEAQALEVRHVHGGPSPYLTVLHAAEGDGSSRKTTKGGKGRDVPLGHELAALLLEHVAGKGREARVFTTEKTGAALHYDNLRNKVFNDAVDEAGLSSDGDRLTMHDLRHYACTAWLNAGIPPHTVQRWMGHKSVQTTMRYAHVSDSHADMARAMVRW